MKNDLKLPAHYALIDQQEMVEVTGGTSLLDTAVGLTVAVAGLAVGAVASAGIIVGTGMIMVASLAIAGFASAAALVAIVNDRFKSLAGQAADFAGQVFADLVR